MITNHWKKGAIIGIISGTIISIYYMITRENQEVIGSILGVLLVVIISRYGLIILRNNEQTSNKYVDKTLILSIIFIQLYATYFFPVIIGVIFMLLGYIFDVKKYTKKCAIIGLVTPISLFIIIPCTGDTCIVNLLILGSTPILVIIGVIIGYLIDKIIGVLRPATIKI